MKTAHSLYFTKWVFITCIFALSLPMQAFERIVSINLCTDSMLYLLEDPANIASVSFLASDSNYSYLAKELKAFPANNAQIEEIIQYHPDLILAGTYTEKHTIHFLRELGYRVEQIDIPQDMAHIEQGIRQLGELLGKKDKASHIINNMTERRKKAENLALAKTTKPLAVILAPDGFTHGKNSMNGDLLKLAGYRNLAEEAGIVGNGNLTLEQLILAQPQFLIIEDATPNRNSLSQRMLDHNALTTGLKNTRHIYIHPNLWTCGGPSMIDALEILVQAHP